MNRNTLNFIIDTLLLVAMAISVFTGLLLAFAIAKGHGAPDAAKYLWGLHRHEWGDIHTVFTVAMSVLMVAHLALHMGFYRDGFRRYIGMGAALAVIATLALTVGTLAISMALVPKGKYDHGDGRHHAAHPPAHDHNPIPTVEAGPDGAGE